ncbi:hypothetical protein MMC30_000856 [Trapelia coarctata]|nr:hypothetical protein [Trapelia coarctata]
MKPNTFLVVTLHFLASVVVNGIPFGPDQDILARDFESGAMEHNSLFARMADPAELTQMLPNHVHGPSGHGNAALLVNPAFSKGVFMATQEKLAMRKSNALRTTSPLGAPRSRTQKRKRSINKAKAILYSRAAKALLGAHLGLGDRLGPRSLSRRHPLAHEVIEGELVKRYLRFERNNPPAAPNPLDPCAGKHGFKRRKCKLTHAGFFNKVKKFGGKAWNFAKHHKGEIALNVGLAVGGLALEAVTLGSATPLVAGAAAAANVASKAGTAVKLGEGAIKLAEGAKTVEKVAKGAQMAEKVAQGAQTAEKLAKGAKLAENAGDAVKAANTGKGVLKSKEVLQGADAVGTAAKSTSKLGKLKEWTSSGFQTVKQETVGQVNSQIQQTVINKATGMGGSAPNAVPKADGPPGGHALGNGPAHGHGSHP